MKTMLIAVALAVASAAAVAQVPKIADAWARSTVSGQTAGGGYLRIDNKGGGADRLVAVSADVSTTVELHTMTMDGDVMRMREVSAIEVPAGQTIELKPGGFHIMFMGLKAPLKAGSSFPLMLKFEKAGEVKTRMQVAAPGADKGHDHHK